MHASIYPSIYLLITQTPKKQCNFT